MNISHDLLHQITENKVFFVFLTVIAAFCELHSAPSKPKIGSLGKVEQEQKSYLLLKLSIYDDDCVFLFSLKWGQHIDGETSFVIQMSENDLT